MGGYEIVIGKRDGKILVEGKGFSGSRCLEFLGRLKLGFTVEERLEAVEPHHAPGYLVNRCVRPEGDGKGGGGS
jgi:hypothetical protein